MSGHAGSIGCLPHGTKIVVCVMTSINGGGGGSMLWGGVTVTLRAFEVAIPIRINVIAMANMTKNPTSTAFGSLISSSRKEC